ncbi:hypothetical protein N9Y74_03050 [Alphaproteobacteria bacterium]|nr:hypothetical protein [Alphaproteobacteria bacterium]
MKTHSKTHSKRRVMASGKGGFSRAMIDQANTNSSHDVCSHRYLLSLGPVAP